jgi:hypothetical protein
MDKDIVTDVIYKSGTHPTEPTWDVMQVIHKSKNANSGARLQGGSFVIARTPDGTILRRTDVLLERWETITNDDDRRFFQSFFETRDKLAREQAAEAAKKARA